LQTQPLSEDGDHEEAEEGDFDVEKWAHEVMSLVASDEAHVGIEEQQVDVDERATVTTLMESTCGCKKGIGSKPCSSQFSTDHLLSVRASCSELTRSELDMVVMGQLMAGMNDDTRTTPHRKNIKKYHHFRFSSSSPGNVFAREHADTTETQLSLLRDDWHPAPDDLAPLIAPKGLSDERQWYLYKRIRPFCSEEHRETATPHPPMPNPKRRRTPAPEE
jgi:hypothetical protein